MLAYGASRYGIERSVFLFRPSDISHISRRTLGANRMSARQRSRHSGPFRAGIRGYRPEQFQTNGTREALTKSVGEFEGVGSHVRSIVFLNRVRIDLNTHIRTGSRYGSGAMIDLEKDRHSQVRIRSVNEVKRPRPVIKGEWDALSKSLL